MNRWNIYKIFKNDRNILVGTTTKNSQEAYSFSLAIHTGEKVDLINLNRKMFEKHFPENCKFVSLAQIHSSKIIDADKLTNFNPWLTEKIEADGIVTSKKNIALTILTADCLGVLAVDNKNKIIGACHAGWRGTKSNIAKNMIEKMVLKGAKIENIKVALTPCIKSCCYEIGEDVAKHFFDFEGALVKKSEKKWHLNLSYVNKMQLLNLGIKNENIEVSNKCTSCNTQNYFSYRKERGCSGRFMSYICMVN